MRPVHTLTDSEKARIYAVLAAVGENPYLDYPAFSRSVATVAAQVPDVLPEVCGKIRADRERRECEIHVVRNCPVDEVLPALGHRDPLSAKYQKKKTFVAEAFLELFARLAGTPLLAYETRFNGDFFCDVIAHDKYRGQQTGFTDGDLVYHNDRTAHRVRADFISLLGMRCPDDDLVYTNFVGGPGLLELLTPAEQKILREPLFTTPFDVLSKDNNRQLMTSGAHPILENAHSFRYLDTHTLPAPDAPAAAKDAVIALKNALARAAKQRHRILVGDLLTFANQDGLHNRENIDVTDPGRARDRWLLKTYAFRDDASACRHSERWVGGVAGLVGD